MPKPARYPAPPGDDLSDEISPYAWMSVGDGELIKDVLLAMAASRQPGELRVLEWGAGRSTLAYSAILSEHRVPFRWLALEYDREFCDAELAPELLRRPAAVLSYIEDGQVLRGAPATGAIQSTEVVCWNRTTLRPFLGDAHAADRAANLDGYVDYPRSRGEPFDVIVVDGRKRRRCLLTALDVLAGRGVVLLHDAFRTYYHCAIDAYPSSRPVGDELWIGGRHAADLAHALAGNA